ncbi:hypothetical protein [Acidipila sp. EB88]|uniref:hypothetical protein n=1 Tax=Acidipila sp. EB88 TaxID=2305226 RepID=UPI000F5F5CF2|nr:hypothetical protein [Acidipila sp. EB88]RRA50456.1 hypothetical protein D1Y84_00130 [Acidipila sp. EB88]
MRPVDSNTLCIDCGKPALERSATEAAKREVGISGICGVCWDNMHGVEPEDDDEDDWQPF